MNLCFESLAAEELEQINGGFLFLGSFLKMGSGNTISVTVPTTVNVPVSIGINVPTNVTVPTNVITTVPTNVNVPTTLLTNFANFLNLFKLK